VSESGWIVCPAFNEADNIAPFVEELRRVIQSETLQKYRIVLMIVDDGSTDSSAVVIDRQQRLEHDFEVRSIAFSRNFGQQAALIAGLDAAAQEGADWAVTMDIDLEHPLELVPKLVQRWETGASIVHTVRESDPRVSWLKRKMSQAYYWLLRAISNVEIRPGMADFKLWDGELLRQVRPFLPQCGLLRLFASWLSPNAPTVHFEQRFAERASRFTWRKMFSIGFSGLVRYSEMPLRFFLLTGILSFLTGLGVAIFALVAVLLGKTVPGWASILIPISVFGAFQGLSLGVLAEYFVRLLFRRSLPPYVTRRVR
jgi:dolichol-phosphate mannosyltransferase